MTSVPVKYSRISTPNATPLLTLCQKYKTDQPDVALRRAAKLGDVSDVECFLFDYDVTPDNKSSNGFTALDWALQDGKLPKETLFLLYSMQRNDSTAKDLLTKSISYGLSDKNALLAYAIYKKNIADQTVLIETFEADINEARQIFMNTTYEDESFEDQFLKKCIELSAQESAKEAQKAMLVSYRRAFCNYRGVLANSGNLGIANVMAGLNVAMSTEFAKEMQTIPATSWVNVERRLTVENPRMASMLRMFRPVSMSIGAEVLKKSLPTQQKIFTNAMEHLAQQCKSGAEARDASFGI